MAKVSDASKALAPSNLYVINEHFEPTFNA